MDYSRGYPAGRHAKPSLNQYLIYVIPPPANYKKRPKGNNKHAPTIDDDDPLG